MSSKRNQGMELLKKGYSYNEIQKRLEAPKSTISHWFSKLSGKEKSKIRKFRIINWKRSIRKFNKARHLQKLKEERKIRNKAAKKIERLSRRELMLVGASLYWAEGSKFDRWHLQFSNSDSRMISFMMRFFREICGVKEAKFYLQMILHENIREEKALNFWSKITKIPKKQFKRACYSLSKSSKRKRPKRRLPFGTLQIRIHDKQLTHKVYGYIEGLQSAGIVQW